MSRDKDGKDAGDEGFLARWSRRKRSGDDSDALQAPATAPQAPADGEVAPPFDITTLPKIEDLLPSSDIAAFLQKGVPEELKRQAMRRMWTLDPQIRDFIEVAENQYDWNVPGGVPGYGEIAAGTDIKALLAQATGQILPPEAPAKAEALAAPSDDTEALPRRPAAECATIATTDSGGNSAAPLAAQHKVADAAMAPVDAAMPLAPDISRNTQPEQEKSAGSRPAGRRHGGALPAGFEGET